MLPKTAVATGLLSVLAFTGTGAEQAKPDQATEAIAVFKKNLPSLAEDFAKLLAAPEPTSGAPSLPKASLTEPFEIGEALYDAGRVANAVVSLLGLMEIGIVSEASATTRAPGITLSESEVRALIDLARDDIAASENDMERLPYTFKDLHAGIAGLLPGVSVEALSESYTKIYEARSEDLIPKAMMGRPIEPETTLTRAQIWFLIMDGFAGAAAPAGKWGTADREVPDLKSPNPQWSAEEFREVLARLPLVTASRLVTMTASDVVSQGATAGPPVNVTVRVAASPPPIVSRITGRTLLSSRAGSLAGQEVTWSLVEESIFPELGKIVTAVDQPTPVGPDGIARFVIQPGMDPTRGAGQLVEDWEPIEARFDRRALLASAYTVPPPLAGLAMGATRSRANVRFRIRSRDVFFLYINNSYQDINFEIPVLGGGTRDGDDRLAAQVIKRSNGSYSGAGIVTVNAAQMLRGGNTCQLDSVSASQDVRVKMEPQKGFGPTHKLEHFRWADAKLNPLGTMEATPPDGGYYRIMIYPVTEPLVDSDCIPNIPAVGERWRWGTPFIPLNDAQWTTSGQGYGIALRAKGLTSYFDESSVDPLAGTPLEGVKTLLQLTGKSIWLVLVGRTMSEMGVK